MADNDKIDLVNDAIVEDVFFDLGKLDFGKGVEPKSDAAPWD